MAILKQKLHHFCLYFPEALLNKFEHGTKLKILLKQANWFYLKSLGTIITKLWSFVLAVNLSNLTAFVTMTSLDS